MELSAYRQMAETEDRHWWFCGRRAVAQSVIETLSLPPAARILEIGAGTGGNMRMLEEFGSVTAVEMSDLARSIALEKTGRAFLPGFLPDNMPFDRDGFDLVCLFDVLEHVEEDAASLRTIADLMAPGGRLLLTVPAHQWLWSLHDRDLHHFRRYSKPRLRAAVAGSGLVVERLTYANAALFPLAVLSRLLDRFRATGTSSGSKLPPAPLNAALKAIYAAERHWLPHHSLPWGVSLLAVLKRGEATSHNQVEHGTGTGMARAA